MCEHLKWVNNNPKCRTGELCEYKGVQPRLDCTKFKQAERLEIAADDFITWRKKINNRFPWRVI